MKLERSQSLDSAVTGLLSLGHTDNYQLNTNTVSNTAALLTLQQLATIQQQQVMPLQMGQNSGLLTALYLTLSLSQQVFNQTVAELLTGLKDKPVTSKTQQYVSILLKLFDVVRAQILVVFKVHSDEKGNKVLLGRLRQVFHFILDNNLKVEKGLVLTYLRRMVEQIDKLMQAHGVVQVGSLTSAMSKSFTQLLHQLKGSSTLHNSKQSTENCLNAQNQTAQTMLHLIYSPNTTAAVSKTPVTQKSRKRKDFDCVVPCPEEKRMKTIQQSQPRCFTANAFAPLHKLHGVKMR